jgi:hypothetical protein
MNEFLLLFRKNEPEGTPKPSPEQMQNSMKLWMDWLGGIAAQNKLVSNGNRLYNDGVTISPNEVITNGPYVEIKELIGGYSIIRAESQEEAIELSKGCPILQFGGSVEVRMIMPMEM